MVWLTYEAPQHKTQEYLYHT